MANAKKMSKPRGTIISKNKALEVSNGWHGGQNSALYSFVSTKKYFDEYYSRYIQEIVSNKPSSGKDKAELNSLKKFFDFKHWEINNNGLNGPTKNKNMATKKKTPVKKPARKKSPTLKKVCSKVISRVGVTAEGRLKPGYRWRKGGGSAIKVKPKATKKPAAKKRTPAKKKK